MIEKALKAKIESISDGVKSYPLQAPEDCKTPYIVYQRSGTDRVPTLDEQGMYKVGFQLTIAEKSYTKMVELRAKIRNGIQFQTGVFAQNTPEVSNLLIENENEFFDSDMKEFIGILDILIIYN